MKQRPEPPSKRDADASLKALCNALAALQRAGDVRAFLMGRGGIWAEVLGPEKNLRMAYDHEMTEADTELADGGEVAFFPPVTGG